MKNQYNKNNEEESISYESLPMHFMGLHIKYVPSTERGQKRLTEAEKIKSFRKLSKDITRFIKTRIK